MDTQATTPAPATPATAVRTWPLLVGGLLLFHLCSMLAGSETRLWLPGLAVGIALSSWLGWRALPWLAADLLLLAAWHADRPWVQAVGDIILIVAQIGTSWWLYHRLAHGSRWLDDPRSAALFLLLVPGFVSAGFALLQALLWGSLGVTENLGTLVGILWLSRALGTLALLPMLLVVVTPLAIRLRWLAADAAARTWIGGPLREWSWEEIGETAGLAFCGIVDAYVLVWVLEPGRPTADWVLWGLGLIIVVWASMRLGLRGGCLVAGLSALVALSVADAIGVHAGFFSPLQGNLLAQASTALLVGAASTWVRTNELRYRHIVGRIPVVLYSARLPRPVLQKAAQAGSGGRPPSKPDLHAGPAISTEAEIMLVSPTCQHVFGCSSESLLGPYARWLERILPEDRELVIAALTQLCLQQQPVTCEYRLRDPKWEKDAPAHGARPPATRWVRDTLAPSYSADGLLEGWEGVLEDITEQRALTLHVRRTTGMLQALVANLPTGVYFVQGPNGHPLLVNARARQLFGQREDLAAGVQHLSAHFRLRRPDGTEYPAEDLPVCRALRLGVSCSANDIVVHRPDGRKVPLITWAAPIDMTNTGKPDAAVWVLEDLTMTQQAEAARRESEQRLRGIIEAMAEGVLVQDAHGNVVDCNPAACAILGMSRDKLLGRPSFAAGTACVDQGGTPLDAEDLPDRRVLRDGAPVRDVVLGTTTPGGEMRWLLTSSMPLPLGGQLGPMPQRARVVTTFADITASRRAAESLRQSKEKYEHLVESLPLMVLQLDRERNIVFMNRVTARLTGYGDEFRSAAFWLSLIEPSERPALSEALAQAGAGQPASAEFRLHTRGGDVKHLLALLQPGPDQGCTCLIVDLSVQRRLERELQNAQRLDLVGRLASGTVHDFNNLLTVMIGLSHMAKMNLPDEHPVQPDLDKVIEAGEQAAHLAGSLLTFSRQRPVSQRAIDLNEVVRQTLKLLKSVVPKTIQVQADLCHEPMLVCGSDTQLKQVIMNLCLNARDAMPAGGKLLVRTGVAASACVQNGQPDVFVSVEDSGQGMDEEVRSHIFEAFYSTKERGTGLGLAVVRQIVTDMGGKIDVRSKLGEGTRIELHFPVYQPSHMFEKQAVGEE